MSFKLIKPNHVLSSKDNTSTDLGMEINSHSQISWIGGAFIGMVFLAEWVIIEVICLQFTMNQFLVNNSLLCFYSCW